MGYILDLLYVLTLVVASPWLIYRAVRTGRYREGLAEKLLGRVSPRNADGTCIWFHAVSVGEVNLLATLIAEIQRRRGNWQCVVSTTTLAGYQLAKKKYAHLTVFYSPLDFTWAVRAALRRVQPNLLVLAELELWPNLIREAKRRGTCVAIVNGRLSERSFAGYRRFRSVFQHLMRHLDLVAVQNQQYAARFSAIGVTDPRLHVTGSMKFDGAQTDRSNAATRRLADLSGFSADDVVFLAGSTQHPEETFAVEAYRTLCTRHPHLRLVLVPRHPERFSAVAELLDQTGLAWQRRSELDARGPQPGVRILLVDTVGELGAWWGTAHIGFVGGSLDGKRGGQNMIEPAAYGVATCFGPHTRNFWDVVTALVEYQAATVVHSSDELTAFVRQCLEHPEFASALGRRAKALAASQLGATHRTADLIESLLAGQCAQRAAA